MDYVAGFLTEYERYASRSQQSVAHAQKLAFLKVVNAAVLIVLIHGNLNAFPTLRRKAERKTSFFGFMRGSYADFDTGWYGTVGVAVLDQTGNLVAGTSTGGMTGKRWGRVGDSPVIGAGTYADNRSGAVSATGHGEYFIRHTVARDICARMQFGGVTLEEAASTVVMGELVAAAGEGGIVAVDPAGRVALVFNTPGMYRASIDADGHKMVGIYGDDEAP